MKRFFYQPADAVSGDYIPFYDKGTFYLFYLKDWRNPEAFGEGTPWYLVTTKDFVHFEDRGEVLPRGTRDEQDLYVFTGSVCRIGDRYHIYYTGHNPYYAERGLPQEAVMHAVSSDLLHWEKKPEDSFCAPADRYERNDWRDAFVYAAEDGSGYRMLLAARRTTGGQRYRGVTALCSSADGLHWKCEGDFYAPNQFYTHECPDLFRMGDWYYLLFSEFSHESVTRYRMSRTPDGPWLVPPDDRLDTTAFYAAKTAGDGQKRFLFGWLATRAGDSDDGQWQWGGCLVCHEVKQRPDGTLYTDLPETEKKAFRTEMKEQHYSLSPQKECVFGSLEDTCALHLLVQADKPFTLALAAQEDLSSGYFLRVDMGREAVLDRWPRPFRGDRECGMSRPVRVSPTGFYEITVLLQGSAMTAYINHDVSLSARLYDRSRPYWGLRSEEGSIEATVD